MGNQILDNITDVWTPHAGTDGSAHITQTTKLAGERNEESIVGDDYVSVANECEMTRITAAATTVINTGPTVLLGILASASNAGTITLNDDTTAKAVLGIGTFTLATTGMFLDCKGARFKTDLNIVTSAADDITVLWRPGDTDWQ